MHWFDSAMNRLINPVVVALLRSPFHGALSRRILVVEARGRRTGRLRRTPANFRREGTVLVLHSVRRRQWWRNLATEPTVRVWLGGRARDAAAEVVLDAAGVEIRLTPVRGMPHAADYGSEVVVGPDVAPVRKP